MKLDCHAREALRPLLLLLAVPAILLLGPVVASLPGCTAAQGRAIEAPLLALGQAACDALLPLALPGLGPLDVLVCGGAESAVAGALAAAGPSTAPVVVGQSVVVPHRPLRLRGKVVAWVRTPADVVARAQKVLDGVGGGAEGGAR